jgi:hypothetical protein
MKPKQQQWPKNNANDRGNNIRHIDEMKRNVERGFAPKWNQLGISVKEAETWPYHIKNVNVMNLEALGNLPCSNKCKEAWTLAKKWLTEPYTRITKPTRLENADIDKDGITKMYEFKHIKTIRAGEVKGTTRIFPRPEFMKKR